MCRIARSEEDGGSNRILGLDSVVWIGIGSLHTGCFLFYGRTIATNPANERHHRRQNRLPPLCMSIAQLRLSRAHSPHAVLRPKGQQAARASSSTNTMHLSLSHASLQPPPRYASQTTDAHSNLRRLVHGKSLSTHPAWLRLLCIANRCKQCGT